MFRAEPMMQPEKSTVQAAAPRPVICLGWREVYSLKLHTIEP
jgi:hypothetical protein